MKTIELTENEVLAITLGAMHYQAFLSKLSENMGGKAFLKRKDAIGSALLKLEPIANKCPMPTDF